MNIEKVLRELEESGSYRRGDCEISLDVVSKGFEIGGKYKIKSGHQISFPNLPGITVRQSGNDVHFSSYAGTLKDALQPIADAVNSIRYPDRHITRRAGCFIEILFIIPIRASIELCSEGFSILGGQLYRMGASQGVIFTMIMVGGQHRPHRDLGDPGKVREEDYDSLHSDKHGSSRGLRLPNELDLDPSLTPPLQLQTSILCPR